MLNVDYTAYLDETVLILDWALDAWPNCVMTSAFGLNGVALIHMLDDRQMPIVFIKTGFLFPQTMELAKSVAQERLVLTYEPKTHPYPCECELEAFLPCKRHTDELVAQCCGARKVEPMRRALAELKPDMVLTPRGRFQSVTRRRLPLVESHRHPVRVNPLAHWPQAAVEAYIKDHGVEYNPLYDDGYFSVGCWPCTRPVENGEDVRAGRWDTLGRVECGLWT